jgi:hypothetical protein
VGLWREARRLEACPEAPALDALRMAAGDTRAAVPVKPDWSRFVDLLGGPLARRKDCPAGVVMVGREGLNQYGEARGLAPYGVACYVSGEVVKAMQAHHEEYPYETPESMIVQVADAMSGARPGARRDSVEQYIKRLEDLEAIAKRQTGVDKAYAIQAGREVRVFVLLVLQK